MIVLIQEVEKGGEVIRIQFCGWGQMASTGLLQGGFEGIRTQFWGQEALGGWVGACWEVLQHKLPPMLATM